MNDVNPILLLMAGLLVVAAAIVWGLGIRVAVTLARRGRRAAGPWVLLAIVPGPIFLGAGYLAHAYRRCPACWVALQAAAVAVAAVAAAFGLPHVLGVHLALDLAVLAGLLAVGLCPLMVLGLLGPARRPAEAAAPDAPLIRAEDLTKAYQLGRRTLKVLRGVSLSVRRGEFLAILGASGSGKSTLLHLLGLLDEADGGSVLLDGADCTALRSAQRDRLRCRDIGFVFQFYHLLPELTVLENTLLPAKTDCSAVRWFARRRAARARAAAVLERLGLADRADHRPSQLSGGERQRVAIARALMNSPRILLADEPTGNLDSKTGRQILKIFQELNEDSQQTIVMVTHDQALASAASRVLHLRDGRLEEDRHGT